MFELAPELQRDALHVGDFPLSQLLLMNDSQFPWLILVPRRAGISEVFQLADDEQQQLLRETSTLAERLKEIFEADKMNIAALGNMVSQLHVHVIVRYRGDAAWPSPVWGRLVPVPYRDDELDRVMDRLRRVLPDDFVFVR